MCFIMIVFWNGESMVTVFALFVERHSGAMIARMSLCAKKIHQRRECNVRHYYTSSWVGATVQLNKARNDITVEVHIDGAAAQPNESVESMSTAESTGKGGHREHNIEQNQFCVIHGLIASAG